MGPLAFCATRCVGCGEGGRYTGWSTLRCAGFIGRECLDVLRSCCKFQSRDTVPEDGFSSILPAQESHCVSHSEVDLSHISYPLALLSIRG